MLYLQKAALTDGREVYEMLQRIPDTPFLDSSYQMAWKEFPGWLARRVDHSQGIGLPEGYVPCTTFWLMDDGAPVAFGCLRHRLTAALREHGGSIGYAVDASQRKKGYGTALVRLMIQEARRMGIEGELLVTAHPDNIGSRKVAEANGGRTAPGDGGACVLLVPVKFFENGLDSG